MVWMLIGKSMNKHRKVKYSEDLRVDNFIDPATKKPFNVGEEVVFCSDKNCLISLRSLKENDYRCPFCTRKLGENLEDLRKLSVFLCHAHSDKDAVQSLYNRLTKDGVDVWLDKENLLPGQDWEYEIQKAVRKSDVVIVCLSKDFNKAGFKQKEVRWALDTAMEKPEGEIFIIPARLEECENLEKLGKWQWVDLFEESGYRRLMLAFYEKSKRIEADFDLQEKHLAKPSDESFVKEIVEELNKQEEKPLWWKRFLSSIGNFLGQRSFKRILGVFVFIGLGFGIVYGLPSLIKFERLESIPTVTDTPTLITFTPISPSKTPTITITPTKTPTITQTKSVISKTKISLKDDALMVLIQEPEGLESFWIYERAVSVSMFSKFVEETGYITDAEKNGIGYVWTFLGEVPATQFPGQTGIAYQWKLLSGVNWTNPPAENYIDTSEVLQVSWNDAKAYCQWVDKELLNEKDWETALKNSSSVIFYNNRLGLGEWGEDKIQSVYRVVLGFKDINPYGYLLFSEQGYVEYRSSNRLTFRCAEK